MSYTVPVAGDASTTTATAIDTNFKETMQGIYVYAADSVGSDAYAITLAPAITAYVTGQKFHFKAGSANIGPATLAVNGLAATPIKKAHNQPLDSNDIKANQIIEVAYDGINFQMLSASAEPVRLFESVSGSQTVSSPTTTETTALSVTIPGGRMRSKGMVRIMFVGIYDDGTSNTTHAIRVKIGATTLIAYPNGTGSDPSGKEWEIKILNAGSESSQTAQILIGGVVQTSATATIDTSADFTITITMQLNSSSTGAFETVENATVEVLPL